MKKITATFASLLAFGIATPAFAHDSKAWVDQMFMQADTDGDGKISRDEYHAYADNKFDDMDNNDDSMLTKSEVMSFKMAEMKNNGKHKNAATAPNRPDNTSADANRSDTSNDAKTNSESSSHN